MFSRQDYQRYFEEIAIIERKMIFKLKPLMDSPLAITYKEALTTVWEDEIRHYGYARSVLSKILNLSFEEKRKTPRNLFLGEVVLLEISSGKKYNPKLIDFSLGGAGLEFETEAPGDERLEAQITFYNEEPPVIQRGRIVWKRQVSPNLGVSYIAGLSFDPPPAESPS